MVKSRLFLLAAGLLIGLGGAASVSAKVISLNASAADVLYTPGVFSIGTQSSDARLQVNAASNQEAIRVISATSWSPFNIRNSVDTADLFRIDQAGSVVAGSVPWARLNDFPSSCRRGEFIVGIGSTLTCATVESGSSQWISADQDIYFDTGRVGIGTAAMEARLQINAARGMEALRLVSDEEVSPFNIRNNYNGKDIFRVDQSGTLAVGLVPWERLNNFPDACAAGQFVTSVGDTVTCASPAGSSVGTGTINYLSKWTSVSALGDSIIFDNGTNVGIGTNVPSQQLEITKNLKIPVTASSSQGVIYRNADRFIHTYGTSNLFFGVKAGNFTLTGANNLAIGGVSMESLGTGTYNTAVGHYALRYNSAGTKNTAVGHQSLQNNTGGVNTAVGYQAMFNNTGGLMNTAIGEESLHTNTIGNSNVAFGYFAGATTQYATPLSPSNSIYIGANAKGSNTTEANAIVIGADAIGLGSNSVVLGSDNIIKTVLKGDVGIGTISPGAKLQVIGTSMFSDVATFSQPITVGTPILDGHAATKNYVDSQISSSTENAISLWGGSLDGHIWNANANYVGIGTTNPAGLLDVAGASYIFLGGDYATLRFHSTASTLWLQGLDATRTGTINTIAFSGQDGSTRTMDINLTNQRVGIGTTNPAYKLDVAGSVRGTDYYSSDGTVGLSAIINVRKVDDSGTCVITVKNGLITATTCP